MSAAAALKGNQALYGLREFLTLMNVTGSQGLRFEGDPSRSERP